MPITRMHYTTASLSENRHFTPEGFLVCTDVPLARIGEQIYGPGETPIALGADGYARVVREPAHVFRPETIASAQGKPIVRDHPSSLTVTPDNFRDLNKGMIINVRQGLNADSDVILGDLLIIDRDEIKRVVDDFEKGLRPEVSMGYECDYEAIGDEGSGLGRQTNIVFNHVALVDQGRCGPRCAIGDTTPPTKQKRGVTRMAISRDKRTMLDRLRAAFKAGDEKKVEDAMSEVEEAVADADEDDDKKKKEADAKRMDCMEGDMKTMKDSIKKIGDSFGELKKLIVDAKAKDKDDDDDDDDDDEETKAEKKKRREEKAKAEDRRHAGDAKFIEQLMAEAPDGTTETIARKAVDSALLTESYDRTVADAEVIAPGLRVPTFDKAAGWKSSFDAICGTRRRALDMAMRDQGVATYVDNLLGGKTFDSRTADCAQTRHVFNSVVAMTKLANNTSSAFGASKMSDGFREVAKGGPLTPADLNRMADERKAERMKALSSGR